MKMRAYWLDKRFSDSKKFPYGFSRSGVFSLAESEILESKGRLFQALMEQRVFDPNEADLAFVQAMNRRDFDFNLDTKIWAKYMFHQRRLISISGGWITTEPEAEILDISDLETVSESSNEWDFDDEGDNDDFLKAS